MPHCPFFRMVPPRLKYLQRSSPTKAMMMILVISRRFRQKAMRQPVRRERFQIVKTSLETPRRCTDPPNQCQWQLQVELMTVTMMMTMASETSALLKLRHLSRSMEMRLLRFKILSRLLLVCLALPPVMNQPPPVNPPQYYKNLPPTPEHLMSLDLRLTSLRLTLMIRRLLR